MRKCQSCDGDVLRTDAFCGTCGEPVPGGKPVVPIVRETRPSGVQAMPDAPSGAFERPSGRAQAAAVVALSDPELDKPEDTGLTQTKIRDREPSEPAPVLPLHRKKNGGADQAETETETAKAKEPSDVTASTRLTDPEPSLPEILTPPGPPILASDLLRERMRPSTPGDKTLRRLAVSLGTLGMAGALWSGGAHPLTFVALALMVGVITIAVTPMSYAGRAISLFLLGSVSTGAALWQQTLHGIAPESFVLATATILLSGSLLFRAYYRGARLARIAVTAGVAILATWFVLSGGHESLVRLDGHWQSWAPASTHMAFGLLALLSLMAFMDSTTRGGAHWWAYALLSLYALHIGLLMAIQQWPEPGFESEIAGPTVAAILAGVVGTIVAGVALAQVLVVAYNASASRITEHVR